MLGGRDEDRPDEGPDRGVEMSDNSNAAQKLVEVCDLTKRRTHV